MPSSVGPNIIGENNIVLAYDTGDTVNSYKGEPTTNLYTTLGFGFYQQEGNHSAVRTTGPAPDLTLPSNYDYTTVTATGNWQSEVNRLIIWTDSGLSSGTYNISFWARVTSTASATIGCAFYGNSLNQSMSLTTQWQRFSIQSTTHSTYRATEFGSLSGAIVFQIAGLQIEAISHVTPYVSGTRSVTQGLLPIISNTSLDLSNMSYTSNAQITFDGTNDYIDIGNLGTIGNEYSIECIFNSSAVVNYRNVFDMNYATYAGVTGNVGPRLEQYSDGTFSITWSGVTNNNSLAVGTTPISISANTNYHVTFVQNGLNGSIYLNGVYRNQTSNTYGYIQTFGDANLGRGFELAGDRYFIGSLPVFKVYNRALTSSEI